MAPEEAMPEFSWPGPRGNDVSRDSPFQVFFYQHVLEAMWQHAHQSPRLECAGVLFGHPFVQQALESSGVQVTFVIVAVVVPYAAPEQTQGHVRVTAEALAAADAYVAREHAGLQPVGWYHTHPGHGIFLSGYDHVITRSIFDAAWHVAVVLDPLRNEMGLFRGAEGKPLPGYRTLRELPFELILMQLYNQGCDLMAAGRRPEALQRFRELDTIFRERQQTLPLWRDRPAYRDTTQRQQQLEIALQNSGYVLSAPSAPGCSPAPQQMEGSHVAPRAVEERIADRTLETMGGIVRLPDRVLAGVKSVISRLAHGGGRVDG